MDTKKSVLLWSVGECGTAEQVDISSSCRPSHRPLADMCVIGVIFKTNATYFVTVSSVRDYDHDLPCFRLMRFE